MYFKLEELAYTCYMNIVIWIEVHIGFMLSDSAMIEPHKAMVSSIQNLGCALLL